MKGRTMTPRPRPYDLTTHDGKTVDWRTKVALLRMERILSYPLSVIQGSPNVGVAASGGTHNGHGAVDLAEWDWQSKVRAGRLCGFIAWHRPKLIQNGELVWNGHVHMIQAGNALLSTAAADQVDDFRNGRDGLASNGPDPHAGMVFRPFRWPYAGPIGVVRWQRDQLRGAARAAFERSVVRRLNLTRKDLP